MTKAHPKQIIALLASTFLTATAAHAQADPSRYVLDANGVDVTRGTYTYSKTDISIGTGDAALSLVRPYVGLFGRSQYELHLYQNGSLWSAEIGTTSLIFSQSGSTFTTTLGDGATMTQSGSGVNATFTVILASGVQYTYGYSQTSTGDVSTLRSRISQIKRPTGETLTISWNSTSYCTSTADSCPGYATATRLQAISNNTGYQLHFNYASDTANDNVDIKSWASLLNIAAINTTVDPCDPTIGTCSLAHSWPTVSYNNSAPDGLTISTTDPLGRTLTSVKTLSPNILSITRPGRSSADIVVNYDAAAHVSSVQTGGVAWNYAYSTSGNTATMIVTGPSGEQRTIVSDLTVGLPTQITDKVNASTNAITSYTYDSAGRLATATAPEGNSTTYGYDVRGNVSSVTVAAKGNPNNTIVTSAAYPTSCTNPLTCNQPITTTDARLHVTNYGYDPTHGGVTVVTSPADVNGIRPETRYSYTSYNGIWRLTGTSTCRTTANCSGASDETRTSVVYTGINLLPTSTTIAAGDGSLSATTGYSYDSIGNLIAVDGPLPGTSDTTNITYDADREVTLVVGPDPDGGGPLSRRAISAHYIWDGLVDSRSVGTADAGGNNYAALQSTTSLFDVAGRATQVNTVGADGVTYGVMQYSYDASGRLQCATQRMNSAAFSSLPAACSLGTQGSFGMDRISLRHYDLRGRVDYATSAYGTADAATENLASTLNGKTASVTDANGNLTSYGYDGFDRATTTTYPGGTYEQLGYDATGNITSRQLRDGQTLSYTYDALNRRTNDTNPGTNVAEVNVTYSYDNLGHILKAQDGNGWYAAYSYDALSRATQLSSNISSNALQYDIGGRLLRQTWADGFYVTYDYNTLGETTAIHENGGAVLVSFAYDNLGRRTSLTRANGTVTSYGYDAASRLTSLGQDLAGTSQDLSLAFAYSPAGQIASRTSSNDAYAFTGSVNTNRGYSVNALNQYTASGSVTPTYDARGNLTQAGGQTYQYNTRNQLFRTGDTSQLFYRDPAGTLGQILSGGGGENLDYVADLLTTEFDAYNGSTLRRYVYGPGNDEPLVWYEGSGTSDRRYLHADERGSVIAVTNDAGNAVAINTYDEFGIPGSGNIGRFQYTGQKWIPELGMYDYKARMYSPTLGRFMQTDPIGYGDGLNWYNYAGSDPVNFVDPSGRSVICSNGIELANSVVSQGDPCTETGNGSVAEIEAGGGGGGGATPGGGFGGFGGFGNGTGGDNNGGGNGGSAGGPGAVGPAPAQPQKVCTAGALASRLSTGASYAGTAQDLFGRLGGEAAEPVFGPIGYTLSAIGAVFSFASSSQRGAALDVSLARAGLPLAGAVTGGIAGATGGIIVGGALGSEVPIIGNIAGAAVGGYAGGVSGAVIGEKSGDLAADGYSDLRGATKCP